MWNISLPLLNVGFELLQHEQHRPIVVYWWCVWKCVQFGGFVVKWTVGQDVLRYEYVGRFIIGVRVWYQKIFNGFWQNEFIVHPNIIIRFIGTSVVHSFTEKWHLGGTGKQKRILARSFEKLDPHSCRKGMIFR